MKLTLTSIQRYTTDRDNKPLQTKEGKPYERVLVKAQEYGDKLISGFGGQWNSFWKKGDVVEVDVIPVKKGENEYLNFKHIDKLAMLEGKMGNLEDAVFNLEKRIFALEHDAGGVKQEIPDVYKTDENEPSEEDLQNTFGYGI